MQLLARALLRHFRRQGMGAVLALLGLSIGVALVVGLDIARDSALSNFQAAAADFTGRATHHVKAAAGPLDQSWYSKLYAHGSVQAVAPVIERSLRVETGQAQLRLRLRGIDPLAEVELRGGSLSGTVAGLTDFVSTPNSAVVSRSLADQHGWQVGTELSVSLATGQHRLTVVGLFEGGHAALADRVVVDLATAQELLADLQHVDRLDVITDQPEQLRVFLPEHVILMASDSGGKRYQAMVASFQVNLQALGLLALLVGLFLVASSAELAVVQRQPLIALLRLQGVDAKAIGRHLLSELLILGIWATLIGLVLGWLLAGLLGALTARTIDALYTELHFDSIAMQPMTVVKAVALGPLAAVLAGLLPLRRALRIPARDLQQRSLQEEHQGLSWRWRLPAAALCAVLAVLLLQIENLQFGFVVMGLIVVGGSLLVPVLVRLLLQALLALCTRLPGMLPRLALRQLLAEGSRTALATTALAVALSASVSIAIMVVSFRMTLTTWLERTLIADVYVRLAASPLEGELLDQDLVARLRAHPAVASHMNNRNWTAAQGTYRINAIEMPADTLRAFTILQAQAGWERDFLDPSKGGLLITESFAYRYGVGVGDQWSLDTDRGAQALPIIAICRDYGTELGQIYIPRHQYLQFFADHRVTNIGLMVQEGTDLDAFVADLYARAGTVPVTVQQSAVLREESLEIFDQTFAVTRVMRLLALLVALIGLATALGGLQVERERQAARLRAIGCDRRQVTGLVFLQNALLGFVAGVIAIPWGILLAQLMTEVVNRRSFGWSIDFHFPISTVLSSLLLAVVVALLAGAVSAWRQGRVSVTRVLREE